MWMDVRILLYFDISHRFPQLSLQVLARKMWTQAGIYSFYGLDVRGNSTIAITSKNIIQWKRDRKHYHLGGCILSIISLLCFNSHENQTFSLLPGLTNLLGLNPLSNPAPNPLILPLPSAPTVYVLPVKIFPFAILNYRQLSLFSYSFIFGPKKGESTSGDILSAIS